MHTQYFFVELIEKTVKMGVTSERHSIKSIKSIKSKEDLKNKYKNLESVFLFGNLSGRS